MATVMFAVTLLTWIFCLKIALSAPTDGLHSVIDEAELTNNHELRLMGIVPGNIGSSSHKAQRMKELKTLLQTNGDFRHFMNYSRKGVTMEGRTFNIYNDDMREAALSLFGFIKATSFAGYDAKELFDFEGINPDIVRYAFDLNILYGEKHPGKNEIVPPFIGKPNYFVNGETIFKAIKISNLMNYKVNAEEAQVNQYFKIGNNFIINTNYSGWNSQNNECETELNYFREDVSLNSYYYGVHLMHPYWLSNENLDEIHPRHNEHYYYTHQQLLARFLLEKEHIKQGNMSRNDTGCRYFYSCLVHANGLPFPHRSNVAIHDDEARATLKTIDIAIRECMERGLLIMGNATTINMTEDNYTDLLVKLIRANYESTTTSKIVRFLFGYGGNGNSYDEYNPAPSLLHYPETTLRDPTYWYLMEYILEYFIEYKQKLQPFSISDYDTENYTIIDANIPKITTYFDYYQFNINRAITDTVKLPLTVAARQKRLKHSQFTLTFTVESKVRENVIVRLFLGPPCDYCWTDYSQFFELDFFEFYLQKGVNFINWSSESSTRLSNDEYYNLEESSSQVNRTNKYNMFKFPENLLIPRGLENGLNLTLFIIITPSDDVFDGDIKPPTNFYHSLYNELDNKPLGFPFHRPSDNSENTANNYKFYKILVHHKHNHVASNGYFSSNLY